ncbi:hypothetical protein RchiOBHm_Chr2g0124751 [Rosa chinensis]|uniref:Uncharacterized protein n=1 Tax=Rosa chinensis TaxID=74649 RepID=A0A2P6RTF4_ROSCH|nr:hypothetical protein RchiOBHm_Chr2g0124751 [Rosa chinensis]
MNPIILFCSLPVTLSHATIAYHSILRTTFVDFSAGATDASLMPPSRLPQFSMTGRWKSSKQQVPRSVLPDLGSDKVVDMVKD